MSDAVAFEPKGNVTRVTVAVQGRDRDISLAADEPYVTKDPLEIALLDQAEAVKRVATADTKAEAREAAEAKHESKSESKR